MATQSREYYRTNDSQLNTIFNRISERLDLLEGLRPDSDAGLYTLDSDKLVSTTTDNTDNWDAAYTITQALGTMSTQDANDVDITGGDITSVYINGSWTIISIYDAENYEIHAFSLDAIASGIIIG